MADINPKALQSALQWYVDQGVDSIQEDKPVNRILKIASVPPAIPEVQDSEVFLGKSGAYEQAVKLAVQVQTLEELQAAIQEFEGLALKKTATNLVFGGGNQKAKIMLVGEAPGTEDDRQGKVFLGESGELLDKIWAAVDMARDDENSLTAVYLSNILNWRPPGNRTPAPAEIEISLPFIEKHIQLIQPDILIMSGGVAAKALLGRAQSLSKLRKQWHSYQPQTPALRDKAKPITALVTFHPTYLLSTPAQKKAAWADMLMVQEKRTELGIKP